MWRPKSNDFIFVKTERPILLVTKHQGRREGRKKGRKEEKERNRNRSKPQYPYDWSVLLNLLRGWVKLSQTYYKHNKKEFTDYLK